MLYLPITRDWILSRTARTIYLICAFLAVALFGELVAIHAAMDYSGARSLASFPVALSVSNVLLFPSIIGSATLTVAMWYFWYTFDSSSALRKFLWFIPLYFLPPIGPALYYLIVYRKSSLVATASLQR
jgi:hypothetical protein